MYIYLNPDEKIILFRIILNKFKRMNSRFGLVIKKVKYHIATKLSERINTIDRKKKYARSFGRRKNIDNNYWHFAPGWISAFILF